MQEQYCNSEYRTRYNNLATAAVTLMMIFFFLLKLFHPFLLEFIIACYGNRHGEVSKGSATPLYGKRNRVGRRKTKAISRKRGNCWATHFTVSVGIRYARRIGIEAEFRVGVLFELVKVNDSVQVLALLDGVKGFDCVFGYDVVELHLHISLLYLYLCHQSHIHDDYRYKH